MTTLPPMLHESMEMLGIISALREKGRHHAPAAHTRRSPAMARKERPDAAYSLGSPCSRRQTTTHEGHALPRADSSQSL